MNILDYEEMRGKFLRRLMDIGQRLLLMPWYCMQEIG